VRRLLLTGLLSFTHLFVCAQVLGGASSFNFLRLPAGALTAAQGGLVLCTDQSSIAFAAQNPSLLESTEGLLVHSSISFLPGGVKGYFLSGILTQKNAPWATGASVQFVDYGTVPATDAAGNTWGNFRASDWVMQVSASHSYLQHWRGGASLKFAHSGYGIYQASALLADVGIRYRDTASGLNWGASIRNAGFMVRKYAESTNTDLPLELSFGVMKKLKGSPFSVGLTLQRMQQWQLDSDALYDPQFSPIGTDNRRSTFVGQFFNHLIFSTRIEIHPRIQLYGGYNFLRRRELSWAGGSNGMTGFSLGLRAELDRFQLHYGRAYYQPGQSMNQISVELSIKPVSKGWKR